jgi:hypothetical protein
VLLIFEQKWPKHAPSTVPSNNQAPERPDTSRHRS